MKQIETAQIKTIFAAYQSIESDFTATVLTSGHINVTYLIHNGGQNFVLQQLNTAVFKNLSLVVENMKTVAAHLKSKRYPKPVLTPLAFKKGRFLYAGSWRLLPYIDNTQTFEKVQSVKQAYQAASSLSEFHWYLKDLDCTQIENPIPGFINFKQRYHDFESALKKADPDRLKQAEKAVSYLKKQSPLLEQWLSVCPKLPQRLIHADPKISNFLFSSTAQIKAIIDWDTLMVGPILYDFGDMVRSYTNLKAEDNSQKAGANFSYPHYQALKKGFLEHMRNELTPAEINHLDLAGKTVIYVQGIRFLTDYLAGDLYYTTQYPKHNLDRAQNQINLLQDFLNY